MTVSELTHLLKRHGEGFEKASTQIPLTKKHILKIPEVIATYDSLELKSKRDGKKTLEYKKKMSDGTVLFVEEVQTRKCRLAVKTMYIKRPVKEAAAWNGSPLPRTSETDQVPRWKL